MNLAALITAVRTRTGMLSDDQLGTDTNLTDLINAAIHLLEIEMPAGWPWLQVRGSFVTVAADEDYPFTTISSSPTLARIGSLRLVTDSSAEFELQKMSYDDLVTRYGSVAQATPEAWAVYGTTVVLRPVPSQVWTVKYAGVRTEPDLASGDSPIMPAAFQHAIVDQAAYLWYRRTGNTDGAQVAKAEVTHWISKMFGYARQSAGPGRIRDKSLNDWAVT